MRRQGLVSEPRVTVYCIAEVEVLRTKGGREMCLQYKTAWRRYDRRAWGVGTKGAKIYQ